MSKVTIGILHINTKKKYKIKQKILNNGRFNRGPAESESEVRVRRLRSTINSAWFPLAKLMAPNITVVDITVEADSAIFFIFFSI